MLYDSVTLCDLNKSKMYTMKSSQNVAQTEVLSSFT